MNDWGSYREREPEDIPFERPGTYEEWRELHPVRTYVIETCFLLSMFISGSVCAYVLVFGPIS